MIFDYVCKKCESKKHNVRVWDKNDLTDTEKREITCCGEVMEAFIDYSTCNDLVVKASNHLEVTRNIALKRSQEWDRKELPEIKRETIKQKFFSE